MPVKKKTGTKAKKAAPKKAKTKSKSVFSTMKYSSADKFCSKAGRKLKVKRTSQAGRDLRRCQ